MNGILFLIQFQCFLKFWFSFSLKLNLYPQKLKDTEKAFFYFLTSCHLHSCMIFEQT